MNDPADHAPDCPEIEGGRMPSLVVSIDPSQGGGTLLISVWERCTGCSAHLGYEQARVPWRTFHRRWRALLAVWIATWEHRHQVADRVTGGS